MTRYLTLLDYLAHAEAVRGSNPRYVHIQPDLPEVWGALMAPAAVAPTQELYPSLTAKAATMAVRLLRREDADDIDDAITLACVQDFLIRNGGVWTATLTDEPEFHALAQAVRDGRSTRRAVHLWLARRVRIEREGQQ